MPHRGRLSAQAPPDARPAAVLMLLVAEDGLWLPLMRRQIVRGDLHSGQISLPGGSFQAGENAVEAALRESQEELGLAPDRVEVLGELAPQWIPVSGYVVHPVVGVSAARQALVCDPSEVELGFWTDLEHLLQAPVLERPGQRAGQSFTMRGWELEQGFLWGATAMILAELLATLRD